MCQAVIYTVPFLSSLGRCCPPSRSIWALCADHVMSQSIAVRVTLAVVCSWPRSPPDWPLTLRVHLSCGATPARALTHHVRAHTHTHTHSTIPHMHACTHTHTTIPHMHARHINSTIPYTSTHTHNYTTHIHSTILNTHTHTHTHKTIPHTLIITEPLWNTVVRKCLNTFSGPVWTLKPSVTGHPCQHTTLPISHPFSAPFLLSWN